MITIDVFADIACPWCYIGDVRLEKAVAQRPDLAIERRWNPFQLQPGLPKGQGWREFADAKFGGWQQALGAFETVRRAAGDTGINFDLEGIASAANTLDAHRVILFARQYGAEWQAVRELFEAYFMRARDLNSDEELVQVASRAGLPEEGVREMLAGDAFKAEVMASQQRAAVLGIRGVPFFVFNGQYGLSGAQPLDAFLQALDQVAETVR